MTKFYCDICGAEVEHETDSSRAIRLTVKEPVFNDAVFSIEERPMVMCDGCYSKFIKALTNKFDKYILRGEHSDEF